MKVSGQFKNISTAIDYANIRSYIETCRLYGVNEYEVISRLVNARPYTFAELRALKKKQKLLIYFGSIINSVGE